MHALAALLVVVVAVLIPPEAHAAPGPGSPLSAPAVDAACAAKAPGAVAWCMPWAQRVDTPPAGGRSHWVTACSKATSAADRRSCVAASITLDATPRDGVASVLMDGPSTGSGPTGLINCSLQTPPYAAAPTTQEQAAWTTKRAACTQQVSTWATQMFDPDPKPADCATTDISCQVQRGAQDALNAGVRSGIQGLVDVAVQGTVYLLSNLAGWVFTATSIASPDDAFYSTYNSIAGVLVVLIFVFFIVSTIINGLRTSGGPGPLASLGGLVKAVLGITFAGGIAYTIVAAWDQATNAVLEANAGTPYDPSRLVTAFSTLTGGAGTMIVALLLSLLAMIGLLLLFVIMLFRGLLTTGAALFGAMAMTGHVMAETRHWPRRWFWTVNALASSKFFIAELWIYGSRSAYGSNDVMNALFAVLLIWLMVAAPFILLRLTSMWDGYLSDVNAHGILSAAGNPLLLGQSFMDGVRTGAAGAGGPGGSPASGAAGLMDANTAAVATTPGGEAAGIGDGTGRQVADAAATGADGGKVGEAAADPATGSGQVNTAGVDQPNAQEADGIEAGTVAARHDLATGQLTAPGDATGSAGSVPVTPAGASGADPTGGITEALSGMGSASPPGAGTGADTPGAGATPADAPTSPDHDGDAPHDPPPAKPAGGAGSSGGSAAGTAAADVPVVPL